MLYHLYVRMCTYVCLLSIYGYTNNICDYFRDFSHRQKIGWFILLFTLTEFLGTDLNSSLNYQQGLRI